MFFTPFDWFSRKGTFFHYIFKFQKNKKVYHSEENVCFSLLLTVFLVRVHCLKKKNQKSKKKCTLPRKIVCASLLLTVLLVRVHFF